MSTTPCYACGSLLPDEQLIPFGDRLYCADCLEQLTVRCQNCGEPILREENAGDSHTILCAYCRENDYDTCARCGTLIALESAHYLDSDEDERFPYCTDCYHEVRDRAIREYHYKPEPIFYGDGGCYLGVELEIDRAGEDNSVAERLMGIANHDAEHIYCKHDGSLDDGFEIVSHPMTMDYHASVMPWGEVMDTAIALDYRSHQTSTCGLHVHVNRTWFGTTEDEQEAGIARVLYFVERNWNELLIFSRRNERQLDRWAARYGYKDHPQEMLEHIKKGHAGRYTCVNLCNSDTIEFRIFRGTLKYNTFIATLQMVSHICDAALFYSDEALKQLSWSKFVEGIHEPELIQYLKERRLYLNDPVESGVEF